MYFKYPNKSVLYWPLLTYSDVLMTVVQQPFIHLVRYA